MASTFETKPAGQKASVSPDDKIMQDLDALIDRINLGNDMLRQNNYTVNEQSGEAMLQVFGFLRACQPRMIELVEAATQGALQEGTLMRCLEVNDLLTRVLDFENAGKNQSSVNQIKSSMKSMLPSSEGNASSISNKLQQPSRANKLNDDPFADQPDLLGSTKGNLKNDFDLFNQVEGSEQDSNVDDNTLDFFGENVKKQTVAGKNVEQQVQSDPPDVEDDFDIFLRERAEPNHKIE